MGSKLPNSTKRGEEKMINGRKEGRKKGRKEGRKEEGRGGKESNACLLHVPQSTYLCEISVTATFLKTRTWDTRGSHRE